ncbi:MAG: Fic family protein [Bryobacteraceae bacterium]|nr:Fic family protein [Bryobacteraceae bacterium]
MTWNWEIPGWPHLDWDSDQLRQAEERFLLNSGMLAGTVQHLEPGERQQLTVEAMSLEALTTSEIEGETLDRASVQSSIRRQLGLGGDSGRAKPAEQGIAEMIVDVYRTFAVSLTEETLFAWHRMVTLGRTDLRDIGRYRSTLAAMQIVSGPAHSPGVHFEAPPSGRVPGEMARFLKWFNRTAPEGPEPLPALTRAGVAHFYFESIHPFEDGNGRIGRAISEKALAQSARQPTLTALAATILLRRKEYYQALQAANRSLEITPWLRWFAGIVVEAQNRTQARVLFLLDKAKLLDRLRGMLNPRQEKALLRMLREGPEGFSGGLSAGNYMRITGASSATATRDLADLVAKGAVIRRGQLRHARYELSIGLRPVQRVTVGEDGSIL